MRFVGTFRSQKFDYSQNTDSILHFPLYENEANKFIKLFEQSPYGKGEKTIVDTSVRNSWELNSDGFEVSFSASENYQFRMQNQSALKSQKMKLFEYIGTYFFFPKAYNHLLTRTTFFSRF